MEITAKLVMELRERTGVGMMDCKKALKETEGDLDAAIKYLREKGLSKAAKKADRETKEGLVRVVVADDNKSAAMVAVSCETDFVARTEAFVELADDMAKHALAKNPANVDEMLAQIWFKDEAMNVKQVVSQGVAKLGENMQLNNVIVFKLDAPGCYGAYMHSNGKLAVLVEAKTEAPADKVADMLKDIAMHITASNPLAVNESEMDQKLIESEREIYTQKARNDGKPEAMLERIVGGQIAKFVKQNCLMEQEFVKDPDKKVKDVVAETAKELGTAVEVTRFSRFALGL